MAFSFSNFFVTLAALAPTIIEGIEHIHEGAPAETKTQLASDSLNLATGVSQALLSSDPTDQALAQVASQLTSATISSIAQAKSVTSAATKTTPEAASAAVASAAASPAPSGAAVPAVQA